MKIKNEYGVKSITMNPTAKCYCPLGKDWYTNEFEVKMQVQDIIPDYCEVERWVDEHLSGQSLIIEEAIKLFRQHLEETYSPVSLEVSSTVKDAKHFGVRVSA